MPPVADRPLFFLDYDGTLAPIVDDPAAAVLHPEVPDLLKKLAAAYPVWIVTGRHLRDVSGFLEEVTRAQPLPGIGLHGAQQGRLGETPEHLASDEAQQAAARMRATVPEIEGLDVEDKEHAFAVHYRAASDQEAARAALEDWAAERPDVLKVIWGKGVLELRPAGLTKGTAVRRIAAEHPERTPVYLGDDTTDEDAFAALEDDPDAVTIRVGGGQTVARHRLAGPDAVVAYLRRYA